MDIKSITYVLPEHLLDYLFDFFPQETTVSLLTCNKYLHRLAARKLYRKIYLSDSTVATNGNDPTTFNTSRLWSVLKVPKEVIQAAETTIGFNTRFEDAEQLIIRPLSRALDVLVNTFEHSSYNYVNYVQEVSLEKELGEEYQQRLVKALMSKANKGGIRFFHNVFDANVTKIINSSDSEKRKCLESLDIPPENLISSQVSRDYLANASKLLVQTVEEKNYKVHSLSLFADPLLLFNCLDLSNWKRQNEGEEYKKLQVTSLMYHIRDDTFTNAQQLVLTEHDRIHYLSDIIDADSLKSLIVTCWLVTDTPETGAKTFLDKIWKGFKNIEDISFISMIVEEKLIIEFLKHFANQLKRFRFHYALPRDHLINHSSMLTRTLVKYQSEKMTYLDINFYDDDQQFYWYNVFESRVEFHIEPEETDSGCFCKDCTYTKQEIIGTKLFQGKLTNITQQEYDNKSMVSLIFRNGLIPYNFSFDKYPSFVNILKIKIFLKMFNSYHLTNITFDDFKLLYQTLIHHMKSSLEFFIQSFPKLQSLVLNDIPFTIVKKGTIKIAKPVFTF